MGEQLEDPLEEVYGEIEGKGYQLDKEHMKKLDDDRGIYVIPATKVDPKSKKVVGRFMVKVTRFYDSEHANKYKDLINEFRPLTQAPENYLVRIIEDIAPPLEESEFESYAYVIMDSGECNLEDKIKNARRAGGRIAYGETVKAITQTASALRAVAGIGKIHRDVKPANIIIRGQRYELTDFHTLSGIDKGEEGIPAATLSSFTRGTPGYLAPELDEEEEKNNPDEEARDIYSSGIIFYQLLATKTHQELISHSRYREMQKDSAKFFDYLDVEGRIKSTVLREIVKKCLFYDPSKQKEWEKKFRSDESVPREETPWHKRYQTHQELLDDLRIAENHEMFDQIERTLSASAAESSEELAKGLKVAKKEIEGDKDGYVHENLRDLEGVLRGKGISTERGERSLILDAFEEKVIDRSRRRHTVEIWRKYREFKKKESEVKEYYIRDEIAKRIENFKTILHGYNIIIGKSTKRSTKLTGMLDELANKYSPERRLEEIESEEPANEEEAKAILERCDSYLRSNVYSGDDKSIKALVRDKERKIIRKRKKVEATLTAVKQKCKEVRRNYMRAVDADAETGTVEADLEGAICELEGLGHGGFYEIGITKAELAAVDYLLHRLYPGETVGGVFEDKLENAKALLEAAQNRTPAYMPVASLKVLVDGEGKDGFFEAIDSGTSNFKETIKGMEETTRELSEHEKEVHEALSRAKNDSSFLAHHISAVVDATLARAYGTYSAFCATNHESAAREAASKLSNSPVAFHSLIKARNEIYKAREEYRQSLFSESPEERRTATRKLLISARKLKQLGYIDEIESKVYDLLHYIEEPGTSYEITERFGQFLESQELSQDEILEAGKGDLLLHVAAIRYLDESEEEEAVIDVCRQATNRFASQPWFIYKFAEKAAALPADDERFNDAKEKLLFLGRMLARVGEKEERYHAHKGVFFYRTATTENNFETAAKDYNEAGEIVRENEAKDCATTLKSIRRNLEIDKSTTIPENAWSTASSNWSTVVGNLQHLVDCLGESHPCIERVRDDMCRWILEYDEKMKEDMEEDFSYARLAERHLASLKKRLKKARTNGEREAIQEKIRDVGKDVASHVHDEMRYKNNVLPFLEELFAAFGGRDEFEGWLAKKRGAE